ncbi:hypothetical protein SLEP1_g10571 [Rubroshorea leprosula]|uniref:Photosystem II protein I n=1 Tax=Rubroshorea leprosula TaxID=152421 RepID=A0AAV5IHY4_9ROSI|nr:hypothetical protein SLEP1_g10571 [Rubroshorea leprosula]
MKKLSLSIIRKISYSVWLVVIQLLYLFVEGKLLPVGDVGVSYI